MKHSILVVGGAGYIGSHVVHDLFEQGHKVTVFDNLSTGSKRNIPEGVELVEADLINKDQIARVLESGIDVVFHFAAKKAVGESMELPMKYAENNLVGTLNLLQCMHETGVRQFVFSSSAAVYGSPLEQPISEQHPCAPENYYGYTKLAIEENLSWFARLGGLKFASLRYFNATGYDINQRVVERELSTSNLCPIIMESVTGIRGPMQVFGGDFDTRDGTCIRDYIHVNDLSEAHLLAMDYIFENDDSLILNLGAESGTTVLEMIQAAENALGLRVDYSITDRRHGDPAVLVASSKTAEQKLNWKASRSDLETIFRSMGPVYGL
ncbi:MAG: UDP-glucose 4-epimerase [Parasphingorhabdus sp.]|jgi:UDP-glucose 4-epimerase